MLKVYLKLRATKDIEKTGWKKGDVMEMIKPQSCIYLVSRSFFFYTKKFKMKQIKAIPKLVFDNHFTDKEFKYYDYACFISILDIDNNEQKFDKSIDNFLQVKMWDIEEDLFENGELKYEKPNDNELKKIVDFINKHKDKSVFIVHCSAGISRSGAVATFLYDKFLSEIDKEQFRRENKYIRPNLYILNRLKSLEQSFLE